MDAAEAAKHAKERKWNEIILYEHKTIKTKLFGLI